MALPPFIGRVQNAVGAVADINAEALASILGETHVQLDFSDDVPDASPTAMGAQLLANLVARLYPTIHLTGPPSTVELAAAIALQINPNVDISTTPAPTSDHVIHFGGKQVADGPLAVSSCGWKVLVDTPSEPDGETGNPVASLAAACLGAAELFRTVFARNLGSRGRTTLQPGVFNLLTLNETQAPPWASTLGVDLGDVHLAGAGAIGEATILALAASETAGSLTVVDPEVLEESNLQRYVLASFADVGRAKVELALRALEGTRWKCIPVPTKWGADARSGPTQRVVLAALDSARDRLGVAAGVHRRVYNAFTQPLDLGWSRHENFGSEPCLACLYYPTHVRPSEDEVVANAINQPRLRVLTYFATNTPVGLPLPFVNPVAELQLPPNVDEWLKRSLLEDLVATEAVDEASAESWVHRTIGQLYSDGICGGGIVAVGVQLEDQAVVPLAHQSALAGVLLALQVIVAAVPDLAAARPAAIEGRLDLNRGLPQYAARPRQRTPGCICSDVQYRNSSR